MVQVWRCISLTPNDESPLWWPHIGTAHHTSNKRNISYLTSKTAPFTPTYIGAVAGMWIISATVRRIYNRRIAKYVLAKPWIKVKGPSGCLKFEKGIPRMQYLSLQESLRILCEEQGPLGSFEAHSLKDQWKWERERWDAAAMLVEDRSSHLHSESAPLYQR